MTRLLSQVLVSLTVLVALTPADALAEVPNLRFDIAYSAIRTIETEDQRIAQRYYQHNAMVHRMETEMGGEQSVIIMRGDRELMWTVMPAQRMVMEFSILDAATQLAGIPELPEEKQWDSAQSVGRETVNGVATTRWVVRSAAAEDRSEGTLWVSDEGILMRMDMHEGRGRTRMELSDLRVGPQSSSLFEPPADYQRFAVGGAGGLMQGLFGQGGAPGAGERPQPASEENSEDREPGLLGGIADAAAEEAQRGAEDGVRQGVRQGVSQGVSKRLRGLLGK